MLPSSNNKLISALTADIKAKILDWFDKPASSLTSMPEVEKRKGSFALHYLLKLQGGSPTTLRVKIPREGKTSLEEAITNESLRHVAEQEHETLLTMKGVIEETDDPNLGAVRSLAYLPRWNAVVMVELEAINFEQLLFDPWMRLGVRNRPRFELALRSAGRWLNVYHTRIGKLRQAEFSADSLREKYHQKIDQLDLPGDRRINLEALNEAFAHASENLDGAVVPIARQHGDLYFTNVVLTEDNRVVFLDFDPRKQFREPIYFDLSTFLTELVVQKVKVKSLGFLFSHDYIDRCTSLFLEGYFGDQKMNKRFLNIYKGMGMVNAMYWYQERIKVTGIISRQVATLFYPAIRTYLYRKAYTYFTG